MKGKASLKIGLLSALAACAAGAATLEDDFRDPPRSAGVWAWWHWQGDNVTRKGITLDLEAMRDSGVAGATIFTIAEHAGLGVLSNKVNAAMSYRNAEWWDVVAFAVEEAARLGLEIGMHNSPGFSVTGGPWIDPAHAMQKVVWTKRAVPGGAVLKGAALERPWACLGHYRDIAVLAVPDGAAVAAGDILDLTSRVRDGVLDWRAPEGRSWTVYRFGHTPTGQRTHPVPDEIRKTCLETDKLSREATELHIREGLEPLRKRLGRHWGTTFTHITVDSYEAGKQNWSPRFREDFTELAGYDPVPFLPVLDGRTVGSPDRARAFRADMDFVVRRLFARNYHGVLHGWARKSGVGLHLEPYGGPFDPFEAAAASDVPMVEFWNGVPSWLGNRPWLYGGFPGIPGSVGRALGRDMIASEAFTGGPGVSRWTEAPRDFKRSGDAALARGINRLVLQHWVHQPFGDDVRPGMSMGFWGSHFGRTQTWRRPARAFYRYWARCQALLQRGKAVVPVLTVGTRSNLTVSASETDALPLSLFLRKGYVRVDAQGRIALPSGRTYPVLRVPRTDALRPAQAMAVAARTRELVRAGAAVWGDCAPPPDAKGRVFAADRPRAEVLAAAGVRPAVEIAAKNVDALTAERYSWPARGRTATRGSSSSRADTRTPSRSRRRSTRTAACPKCGIPRPARRGRRTPGVRSRTAACGSSWRWDRPTRCSSCSAGRRRVAAVRRVRPGRLLPCAKSPAPGASASRRAAARRMGRGSGGGWRPGARRQRRASASTRGRRPTRRRSTCPRRTWRGGSSGWISGAWR